MPHWPLIHGGSTLWVEWQLFILFGFCSLETGSHLAQAGLKFTTDPKLAMNSLFLLPLPSRC